MPQPRDMNELIHSIQLTAAYPRVIATLVTQPMQALPTAQRGPAQQMLSAAILADSGITNAETITPGREITLRQTDQWYMTHDPAGNWQRLFAIVQQIGQRTR